MLYLLEVHDSHRGNWSQLTETFWSLEKAMEEADRLWEDEDFLYDLIRVKKTTTLCTLCREQAPNAQG